MWVTKLRFFLLRKVFWKRFLRKLTTKTTALKRERSFLHFYRVVSNYFVPIGKVKVLFPVTIDL